MNGRKGGEAMVAESPGVVRFLTRPEVMGALRISESTLDRLLMSGELKSLLVRGRRLVRVEDFNAYVEERLTSGQPK